MRKLCIYPEYNHLYIPLTSKKGKFQPQTNIFPVNSNPFSILSLLLCGSKNINFSGLRSRYDRLENKKKLILPPKLIK